MFEKLIQELQRIEREKIKIPVSVDGDGYLDRECPNPECLYQFKVQEEDWLNICRDEQIFCPLCRHEAVSGSWWTQEQLAHAREEGIKQIHNIIGGALETGAQDFNRKQPKGGFLSLRINYTRKGPHHILMPIPASEELTLKIKCEVCEMQYAVIGSAFFCPSCGHNSAAETFDNSVKKIQDKLKHLETIRQAIASYNKDEAETTCRSLIETSLNEGVVAFQRFCEVSFTKANPTVKIKFNAFQNLDTGGEYWYQLLEQSYDNWINAADFRKMVMLFQKRHLLSHTEGIVDQKYIDRSGDQGYKVGQRLVIKEEDVAELVRLIRQVVDSIRQILSVKKLN